MNRSSRQRAVPHCLSDTRVADIWLAYLGLKGHLSQFASGALGVRLVKVLEILTNVGRSAEI
jgi:hypothetical protein